MKTTKDTIIDEWLVLSSQQGDRQALQILLERWQKKFFGYAFGQLGDTEAAREVTQESLYSVVKGLHSLQDPLAYPKWAYRILLHRIADWQRKDIQWRQSKQAVTHEKINRQPVTDSDDMQRLLQDCMNELGPEINKLLRLYYLDDFSIKDIAELLELPEGTVKSRLYYARKKFQQLLTE